MLDIGFSELLVFGIIALLVLGPEKLPEAARFAAKWYSKFKRAITSVQNDIDRELRLSEFREQMQQEMQRIHELEQKMQAQMDELQQQTKLATQKEQPVALSDNKNLSYTFTYLNICIPLAYEPKRWLVQHQCAISTAQIIAFETLKTPELKVAV